MMDNEEEAPRLALSGAIYVTPAGRARLRTELDALRTERQTVVDIAPGPHPTATAARVPITGPGKRRLREIDRPPALPAPTAGKGPDRRSRPPDHARPCPVRRHCHIH